MARDLTAAQFKSAMERQGFKRACFGYWKLPEPFENHEVYAGNGGPTRRSQLAYMMKQWALAEARAQRETT